jgi:hypothetical protein
MSLQHIPYSHIDEYWDRVAPDLERALHYQDELTLDHVHQRLLNPTDSMQLWVSESAACVTQIQVFPTGIRKCLFLLCGGYDLSKISEWEKEISAWAQRFWGCHKTIIHGRRGWLKGLDGYNEKNTIMEKQL